TVRPLSTDQRRPPDTPSTTRRLRPFLSLPMNPQGSASQRPPTKLGGLEPTLCVSCFVAARRTAPASLDSNVRRGARGRYIGWYTSTARPDAAFPLHGTAHADVLTDFQCFRSNFSNAPVLAGD